MGKIVIRKPSYCHIKLDNGQRILISMAQSGIKIIKLGFRGLLPVKTIWKSTDTYEMIEKFADPDDPFKDPVDAVTDKLINCESVKEIKAILAKGVS